jgi:hypothetical protein
MDNPPEPASDDLIERLRKVSNFLFDNDGYEQSKTVDEARSCLAALDRRLILAWKTIGELEAKLAAKVERDSSEEPSQPSLTFSYPPSS